MSKSFILTLNAKDLTEMERSFESVVSGLRSPDTVNESILAFIILSKQSISKPLSTAVRCTVSFGFNRACSSKKLILRKVRINNTESLKTAVRNKTGAVRGHVSKASHIAIKD